MLQNEWLSVLVLSYLLGAIPTAFVVARLRGVNIFKVGSGNMGATNVARALGLGWGILVWFLDTFKGVVAILIARKIMTDTLAVATVISGLACIVGHNWSIFVALLTGKLRGGKGASVAFASLLLIAPHILPVLLLIGGVILLATRYVSLTVLVMFAVATLWLIALVGDHALSREYTYYALLVAVLILYRFRDNIQRLLTGTERRFGERA
jgi:glycerol-3-phosphate acyltransferase PlsY